MATGVPAIDAIFAAGRGLAAIPEGVRQEGVAGAFKGFLNPKPYEQASAARVVKEAKAPEIQALEDAIDHVDNTDDFMTQVAPLMARIRYEVGADINDEGTYNRVLGPLNARYQAKGRELLGLSTGGDSGDDAESAIRMGTVTGDPSLVKEGQSLSGLFRMRALNSQTEALTGAAERRLNSQPLQDDLTRARTRLASEQAQRVADTPPPRDPNAPRLGDLDRARRGIDATMRDPITHQADPNISPPADMLETYNARARAIGSPELVFVPGRGVASADALDQEQAIQHERQMNVRGHRGGSGAYQGAPTASPAPVPTAASFSAAPYVPQAQDAQSAPAAAAPPQQAPIAAPMPILSGRALAAQLVAQGFSPEEAKARVKAMIAQQQAGAGGGAAPNR